LRKYIDERIELIKEELEQMIFENAQVSRPARSMSDGKVMNRYSHSSALSHLEVEVNEVIFIVKKLGFGRCGRK